MKKIFNILSIYEKKYLLLLFITIFFLVFTPYFYAQFKTPQNHIYNGVNSIEQIDYAVYYSYINQIKSGQFLLYNNFTTEDSGIGIFNIFWFVVGNFAKLFNLSEINSLQIFKAILIPIFILILYIFISYFFKKENDRLITIWILCFSSGFGGIIYLINQITTNTTLLYKPIDIWLIEANTFLTIYNYPNRLLAFIFILLIYLNIISLTQNFNLKKALLTGILGLILFNFHPYHAIPINAMILIFLFLKFSQNKTEWLNYLKIFLLWFIPSTISIIYHYLLILTDLQIGIRASQNITLTPPIFSVINGYGILFIMAVFGIVFYFLKNKIYFNTNSNSDSQITLNELKPISQTQNFEFIILWFCVVLTLVYFPITFQRRFLAGFHIPVTILFIYSLNYFPLPNNLFNTKTFLHIIFNCITNFLNKIYYFLKNFYLHKKIFFIFIFSFILCFSNYFILYENIILAKQGYNNFYINKDLLEGIDWLKKNNNSFGILTNSSTKHLSESFWITAFANQKTFLSHHHETLFFNDKTNELKNLTIKNNSQSWNNFYKKYKISFVFINKNQTNNYFNIKNLKLVFENKLYAIYKTNL